MSLVQNELKLTSPHVLPHTNHRPHQEWVNLVNLRAPSARLLDPTETTLSQLQLRHIGFMDTDDLRPNKVELMQLDELLSRFVGDSSGP